MSLSKNDIDNLKTRLSKNKNLSVTSKTNLNRFIENTKNAFDRTAYNTRMRNLRNRDASLGINSRNGSVYRGSVNPGKRGRNSPRGPLSAVSGTSNTSNNQNNASTNGYGGFSNNENNLERKAKRRKSNSQPQTPPPPPLVTVATAAARAAKAADNRAKANANARAAANNARRKAVANAKKKAIIAQQQGKAAANNARRKAVANARAAANNARRKAVENANKKAKAAAAAQAAENAKAKAKKAKAEKQEKNRKNAQKTINKAITNKRQRNANELNMLRKSKTAANKAAANARATTPANSVRNSVTNIGNGGNSLNNNANSSAFIAPITKRERKADGKLEKEDAGKFMKRGILLEIIKMADRTSKMAKNNRAGLLKLMPMVKNANSITEYHTYTWALLYDMINTLPDTRIAKLQITPTTLKDIHKKLMVKNTYTTGRSTGGMGNRQERVFNFTDEEVVEFLFLIWLDGNHDAYINESFKDWLDDKNSNAVYFTNRHRDLAKKFVNKFPDPRKYINNVPKFSKENAKKEREEFITQALRNVEGYETIRKICIETKSVWFFIHNYNGDPERNNTKLQTSVKMGFGTYSSGNPAKTSLAGNFESVLKMGIEEILNIKQSDSIYTGSREINNLKRNGIHEVSLDQESDDNLLSRTITNTPSFRPYITTANLIDPGKHMLASSAGSDDRTLLLNAIQTQNMKFLDNLKCHYHIGPVKFVIRNGGLNFLKVDLSIRKGGPPKTESGRMPTLDFFELKINETNQQSGEIIQGGKKKNAKNARSKMGKFMGDALQYMTVSVQNIYRKKPRFFASGDGSACFMNAYFCQKLNIPLRLIIDTGVGNIRSTGLQNN
jgi:hypothetical protein